MDFNSYRRWEALALESETSWMGKRIHYPFEFEKSGFPLQLDSIEDLKFLLPSGSNARFNALQEEINGFRDEDICAIKEGVKEYCKLYSSLFSYKSFIVPVEDLAIQYSRYIVCEKLMHLFDIKNPKVLEIGPGTGLQSLFLPLKNKSVTYSQIEVTPSLYILQHWISKIIHKGRFAELANPVQKPEIIDDSIKGIRDSKESNQCQYSVPFSDSVRHYPWWKVKQAFEDMNGIDIIMSHDNVQEMNPIALRQYAALSFESLNDKGFLYIDSLGASQAFYPPGHAPKLVTEAFVNAGFAIAMIIKKDTSITTSSGSQRAWTNKLIFMKNNSPLASNFKSPSSMNKWFIKNLILQENSGEFLKVSSFK